MTDAPDDNDSLPNLQGELRILLQGAQVFTSFLIILPFNADFGRLGLADERIYIATFLCSLTSLVLFSAPALHHYLRRPLESRAAPRGVVVAPHSARTSYAGNRQAAVNRCV